MLKVDNKNNNDVIDIVVFLRCQAIKTSNKFMFQLAQYKF